MLYTLLQQIIYDYRGNEINSEIVDGLRIPQ